MEGVDTPDTETGDTDTQVDGGSDTPDTDTGDTDTQVDGGSDTPDTDTGEHRYTGRWRE